MHKKYFKTILLLFLFFVGTKTQAVITVSFSSTSTMDSVKVENLTRNTSTMLKSNFSVNLENLMTGVQNPSVNGIGSTSNTVVYPNPFNNQVNVEYYATTPQKVYVSVYDIAGRVVSEYNQQMEQGVHKLHFKPNTAGLYLIKVADKTGSSASKVYCLQSSSSTPKLEYEAQLTTSTPPTRVKSSPEADTPNPGDMLRFTGYSAGKTTTQYDVARVSKSYTLTFASAYNVKNYSIQASKPCLVDIMFAVMDANNKGVDYLTNTDFTVSEDGATTSPSETFRYVSKMQQLPSTIKTVLLLDNSLSIGADLATIKAAAVKFVQSMYGKQQVAIYSFSDAPVLLQDFTADKTLLQNAINGISLGFPSTNLYGSAVTALSKWTDTYALTGILQGSLVLFTDGSDTQGSSTLSAVTTARGDKKIYVIGLGAEITASALNSIANPGPYYPIANVSELDAVFATIQSDIAQYANSFYWLNYMTPKRTGSHTLKLEVKNNLNSNSTASFSSSFSATGFTSILSGVCINKDDNHLSGLDTIRCYSSATGYHFYEKTATTLLSNDSLQLNPTTYWAIKPPVFTWSITKPSTSKLLPTTYSTATLYPLATGSDTTVINLQDKANAYTRNAVLVVGTELPTLTTTTPKTVTATTATLGGEVTYTGRGAVTARGICYATSSNPTIANSKVVIGSGKGIYETTVTGLLSSQTYYARAYATNAAGTIYGNEVIFTTLPTVTTTAISAITATTASSGGNVTSTGTATVAARGVCWSTTPSPTTADNKTTDGTSTGVFTSSITGLASGTTYYVRTYSTNAGGTNYGTEVSFTTLCAATTASVSSITTTTATCGGEAISAGGSAVTARGVCWSTTANPTTTNSKTTDGTGSGVFISSLTGLVNGTTYYVRSYVTNSTGTNYGNQVTFTTFSSVTTTAISAITATTATSGGNVTSTGGAAVNARGVCWSTTPGPTIAESKTTDGTSTGAFTSSITGLQGGAITYYVRSYVTTAAGTNYGAEVNFTTLPVVPVLTTTAISGITDITATSGGNVTSIGGAAVTSRGVCWSTTTNPTIANSKTIDGTGIGSYISSLTGLIAGTTYYVKSYATNSVGTSYGNEISFTATSVIPTVTTTALSAIAATTATCGGNVTSTGGLAVTERGVCWSTVPNPSITDNKTTDGTGAGVFTSSIIGLVNGTTYYLRSYSTNSVGTSYGSEISFTTLSVVTTTTVSSITTTSAVSGGNVTSTGGAAVTARGVCWSTSTNPTIANSKTTDGTGSGSYTSSLTGLVGGTTYYVRSYATNFTGTSYGNELNFTTSPVIPTVTTTAISAITTTTAKSGGNVTSSGGAAITARGVCWSTTPSPTIADSKTNDGTGLGTFASSITGLTLGTTYYVRYYATNSIGTSYGTEYSFTTHCNIGDALLGGKVAYIDASGIHGFVCALADQSNSMQWHNGSYLTTGAINTELETTGVYGVSKSGGRKNTDLIISVQGAGTYAASICAALTDGGAAAGDWYLPSKGELNQLYVNKALLGGFATYYYWSSSEVNNNYAWTRYFDYGNQGASRGNGGSVRAVRAF